ncbi:GntR family transcriptional regulator [Actinotignum sp. GS-2025b]|uniref:GntR family transcriptional regulator n=1 Tax=Actinotignum sp. GS-2025b TaxID=3427275 RepID=UPI003F4491DC
MSTPRGKENVDQLDVPVAPRIVFDSRSSTPLHQQITQSLASLIDSGTLLPGQLLEDEVSMSRRLGVSRPTLRRALQVLTDEGKLSRRPRVGTRVMPRVFQRDPSLASLSDDLRASGREPRTDVLQYRVVFADSGLATDMHCPEGKEIVALERLRWAEGNRMGIMRNWIPADLAPSLTAISSGGLYAFFRSHGIMLRGGVQRISARSASATEAELLHVASGVPLLRVRRSAYDESGRIVDLADHLYDAEQYDLTLPLNFPA